MWHTTSIKIKFELPKNYVALEILKQREVIAVRAKKANAILKRSVNKPFSTEHIYHNTNQIDKARKQNLSREEAVIDELKRKYDCSLPEHWERGTVFEHCKYQSCS